MVIKSGATESLAAHARCNNVDGSYSEIQAYIQAASNQNVSVSFLTTMAAFETGGTFNTNAVSPTGVGGLFQFTNSTAADYGLTNRFDAEASTFAAARLAQANYRNLNSTLGNVSDGDLYLAHQQGYGDTLLFSQIQG